MCDHQLGTPYQVRTTVVDSSFFRLILDVYTFGLVGETDLCLVKCKRKCSNCDKEIDYKVNLRKSVWDATPDLKKVKKWL